MSAQLRFRLPPAAIGAPMYQNFYQLEHDPFRLAPDPRFRYRHRSYAAAYRHLHNAYEQEDGFAVVTARPGTGKTTLTEEFIASLDPTRVLLGKLVTTQVDGDELLRLIGFAFGADVDGLDRAATLHRIKQYLTAVRDAGRRAVLVVDEAQGLSIEALEQLRLLSNLEHQGRSLLQIFLVGQEQLQTLLTAPELEQLQQRVFVVCRLAPLSLADTRAYAHHRLCVAGWRGDPSIDPAVFVLIHRFGQGLPRYINRLCNRLLLHGAVAGKHALGIDDAVTILRDLNEELLTPVHDQPGPAGAGNRELLGAVTGGGDWQAILTADELQFLQQANFDPPRLSARDDTPKSQAPESDRTPDRRRPARYPLRWAAGLAALALVVMYLTTHRTGPLPAVASIDAAPPPGVAAAPKTGHESIQDARAIATPETAPDTAPQEAPAADRNIDTHADEAREVLLATRSLAVVPAELARTAANPRITPQAMPASAPAAPATSAPAAAPAETATASAGAVELAALLERAEQALAADRLTVPKDDNAYAYLRAAQRLDPGDPAVDRGLDRIAQRYGVLARWWMKQGEYGKAVQLIERGLRVRPHDAALHALRKEIHALALQRRQPSPLPSPFDEASTTDRSPTPPAADKNQPRNLFDRLKAFLRRGAQDDL